MFDATKLEVGKWYPTRDGNRRRFFGRVDNARYPLAFVAGDTGNETVSLRLIDGRYSDGGTTQIDVVSSDPIKEPVSMQCPPQWAAVFRDGTTSIGYTSKERAIAYAKDQGCIGVYELPETIKVQPV